jgi:hypothetical protein
MSQEKVHVIVEVKGGVVQEIHAASFVDCVVVDWDELNEGNVDALNRLPVWTIEFIKEHYPNDWQKITGNLW